MYLCDWWIKRLLFSNPACIYHFFAIYYIVLRCDSSCCLLNRANWKPLYFSANVSETDQVEIMFALGLGEMYPVELCLHIYRTLSCILMRALGRASDTCMEAFFFYASTLAGFRNRICKTAGSLPSFSNSQNNCILFTAAMIQHVGLSRLVCFWKEVEFESKLKLF